MSDDVNLLDSELDADLRATVRSYLAGRCDPAEVVKAYDGDSSLTADLWKGLSADLGLAGLLIPESHGGAGASARETAVVLEELGRAVAPVPFLTSAVVATSVLLAAPTEAGSTLLGGLAAGERTAALALPLPATSASPLQPGETEIRSVAGAVEADTLLVPVATAAGVEVRAVPAAQAEITPVSSLDMTRRLADVRLDPAAGEVVVAAEDGEKAVRAGLLAGAALMASEQVGVAQWCLTTTLEYLKVRRQFGRIVGGYQALKHRLADLYTSVEGAGAAARYAAGALALGDPEESEIATRVAAAYCGDLAVTAAEEAVQLHGGIGMTWEHPAHLYLKRAKADQIAYGLPGLHRDRLGALVNI
ncbi:alkylation response protein AidB-like acyl-CoA dehydrogenase [Nocardioides luteus]|uniref:Acyl-CoA dehydrogenase n=1 Tax=Nocardioides luteus TaxID=1844 RepID=A0ABQ5T3Q5_9ACTN|nr:acyl-CoA dehydrogenase family protein [Nocardioides luteus]MDR7308961.1 alkylation response protein AidB-like acyl-CoA dehydrogenase [Nocardioides luteus]GGR63427.1 acyl-CoA dehydrogenase [Nocardioides luteus]GLJ70367.1 acyl-CoA dehydrogenase [Nocardioides luteus]